MKQKVLELSFDDVTGKFELESEFNPVDGFSSDSDMLDTLVSAIFEENSKGQSISQIIRLMTMANIAADVQPYEHVEQLWHTMMFSVLPDKEKQYRKMKEEHGVVAKVVEPVSFGPSISGFPMSFNKS